MMQRNLNTYCIVIYKDFLGSGLHLIIVNVAYDNRQSTGPGHGGISGILDDDGNQEFLLLFSIEGS